MRSPRGFILPLLLLASSASADLREPGALSGTRLCAPDVTLTVDEDLREVIGARAAASLEARVRLEASRLALMPAGQAAQCNTFLAELRKQRDAAGDKTPLPRLGALLVTLEATPEQGDGQAVAASVQVLSADAYSRQVSVLWQS